MAPAMSTSRRSRARLAPLALAAAAVSAALLQGGSPMLGAMEAEGAASRAFSTPGGPSRNQMRSQLHTRGQLPPNVLEIPLEEPVAEDVVPDDLPPKRLPYTLNMVTQFPNHKHLSEESTARMYLEKKLTGALDHVEELIKHVELQLRVEENFHREKDGHKKVVQSDVSAVETPDGEIVEEVRADFGSTGTKVLAPYQIKVVVSMRNGKEVIYSNPEKHAEGTLTGAADGMADGLRRLLREEKEKEISARRQAKDSNAMELNTFEDDIVDEIGVAEDAEAEDLYARIDAIQEKRHRAAAAVRKADQGHVISHSLHRASSSWLAWLLLLPL